MIGDQDEEGAGGERHHAPEVKTSKVARGSENDPSEETDERDAHQYETDERLEDQQNRERGQTDSVPETVCNSSRELLMRGLQGARL